MMLQHHHAHARRLGHGGGTVVGRRGRSLATASSAAAAAAAKSLPQQAEVVVVGGGCIGASVAYHLAKRNVDVLLLEKSGLTHGCTWHAAGLVGQLRGTNNLTKMMSASVELYRSLEEETGLPVEWREVGSLRVASSDERWLEIQRLATQARSQGFELDLVSPSDAVDRSQGLLSPDGLRGAAWVSSDGSVDPTALTLALARGARMNGANIMEGVEVTGFGIEGRRVNAVHTTQGEVKTAKVVNCSGLWARHVSQLMGDVPLPTTTVQHQYVVTTAVPGMPDDIPTLRDPDAKVYFLPRSSGVAMGGWEHDTVRCDVPLDFGTELYDEDFERFAQHYETGGERWPGLHSAGVKQLINGPIPISADGEPVMGRLPDLDNAYVCAGFTSGVAAAGGAGKVMAGRHRRPCMQLSLT